MKEAWFLANPTSDPNLLPEYGWRRVSLPHQWSLDKAISEPLDESASSGEIGAHHKKESPSVPEVGWYRLEFPETEGRRWGEIRADYYCEAWVGGAYKGCHEGYFEPWLLEIPPEETLLLRVSAPKEEVGAVWPDHKRQIKGVFGQHDCRPGGNTARGQEGGTGGLWGGVRYLHTGQIALLHMGWRACELNPPRGSAGWKLWIDLEIDYTAQTHPNHVELWGEEEHNGEEPVWSEAEPRAQVRSEPISLTLLPDNFQGETYHLERTLEISPGRHTYALVWDLPDLPRWEVWERGQPNLFELKVDLGEQTLETLLGFRTIAQDGDWLSLNGKRLFLRGTNIIPTQWLSSYSDEEAQRDIDLLRQANLNAVRVHAHLAHPSFYEACDRMGILVWQDFPLQWGYAGDEAFTEEAIRQAQAMVKHYGSHVSIYQWCAHNEPTHNRHTLDPLLATVLRQADSSRLVKETSDFQEHPYPGWYWGHFRDFLSIPGAPLPSEFGAQALPGSEKLVRILGESAWPPDWEAWVYHNFQPEQTFRVAGVDMGNSLDEFVANSQDYQARLIRFAIGAYRRAKGKTTGYFQFMFVDPWDAITWSVLDSERHPKQGYTALKEASTPVLISLVSYRENLEIGQPLLSEAWLINDLPHPLEIRVKLCLEGPTKFPEVEEFHRLEAQSVKRIFSIGEYRQAVSNDRDGLGRLLQSAKALVPGQYFLIGEAWEGERLLSRDELHLTIQNPIVPLIE